MTIAKKRVTRRYFNKWAHSYDGSILQHIIFKSSHKMLFTAINGDKSVKNIRRVLDVGCGTGRLVYALADRLSGAEVCGIDISETMIEKARLKKRDNNVKLQLGDVEDLPYADDTFDIVTCSNSFHHYPDKKKALSEMYRVLRHNGRLMIIDGCKDVLLGEIIFSIVEKTEKHVCHLAEEEFRDLFRENGFSNIVQKRFNFIPLLLTIGTAVKYFKEREIRRRDEEESKMQEEFTVLAV